MSSRAGPSVVAPMIAPVGFLLIGDVQRARLIFDAFDNAL